MHLQALNFRDQRVEERIAEDHAFSTSAMLNSRISGEKTAGDQVQKGAQVQRAVRGLVRDAGDPVHTELGRVGGGDPVFVVLGKLVLRSNAALGGPVLQLVHLDGAVGLAVFFL